MEQSHASGGTVALHLTLTQARLAKHSALYLNELLNCCRPCSGQMCRGLECGLSGPTASSATEGCSKVALPAFAAMCSCGGQALGLMAFW